MLIKHCTCRSAYGRISRRTDRRACEMLPGTLLTCHLCGAAVMDSPLYYSEESPVLHHCSLEASPLLVNLEDSPAAGSLRHSPL